MPEPDPTLRADFARHAELIESALLKLPPFATEAENEHSVQVERGIIYAMASVSRPDSPAISGPTSPIERLIEAATGGRAGALSVVDRNGHFRPAYRPLLIYSWLMAYRLAYEALPLEQFGRWEDALRTWADVLEARLGEMALPAETAPAATGAVVAEACWIALALHVAGKELARDAWVDLASALFGRLVHWQHESGAFLAAGAADNPETRDYHELVILHAAASYAVQTEHRPLSAAVARATKFHQEQTQPDHATSQPWGVFAFAWNQATRPVADALLHASTIQSAPRGPGGIALMLLADALYCLRLFKI
jgi:hypothetical protein